MRQIIANPLAIQYFLAHYLRKNFTVSLIVLIDHLIR